jgi:hypothetical protein
MCWRQEGSGLCWGLAAIEALLRLRLALAWVELLFDALKSNAGSAW